MGTRLYGLRGERILSTLVTMRLQWLAYSSVQARSNEQMETVMLNEGAL